MDMRKNKREIYRPPAILGTKMKGKQRVKIEKRTRKNKDNRDKPPATSYPCDITTQ